MEQMVGMFGEMKYEHRPVPKRNSDFQGEHVLKLMQEKWKEKMKD